MDDSRVKILNIEEALDESNEVVSSVYVSKKIELELQDILIRVTEINKLLRGKDYMA